MSLPESVAAEIKGLKKDIGQQFDEKIKALDKKADERWDELKKSPDAVIGDSLKKILDDAAALRDEKREAFETKLTERLDEIETKAKERGGLGTDDPDAAMTKALDDWGFTGKESGKNSRVTLPTKAVTTITNANANGAGFANRRPGIAEYPQDPLALRDLVMPGTIDGYYFKYERELAGSQEGDAAYQLTEGAAKAAMDIYTEIVTGETATIAVTSRVSQQVFDDRAAFISFLRGRMGYRVLRLLDREILNGPGTSGTIDGVNTNATAFDTTLDTAVMGAGGLAGLQKLDVIRLARLQVELGNYVPDGTALNPRDWAGIELLKVGDGDGRYLIGDPKTGGSSDIGRVGSVWGMPVVSTAGQAADEFTVGDWMGGAQLFMRKEMEILASTEDQDNFVKNLVTLRAELRALLAVYSTLAFVTGDFTSALTNA